MKKLILLAGLMSMSLSVFASMELVVCSDAAGVFKAQVTKVNGEIKTQKLLIQDEVSTEYDISNLKMIQIVSNKTFDESFLAELELSEKGGDEVENAGILLCGKTNL